QAAKPPPLFVVARPAQDHPIPDELPKSKRRRSGRERYEDLYDERDYQDVARAAGAYVYDPRDLPGWRMAQWGLTLVLLCLVMHLGGVVTMFVAVAIMGASGEGLAGGLGLFGLGFLFLLGSGVLQLVGFGLSLGVPRH